MRVWAAVSDGALRTLLREVALSMALDLAILSPEQLPFALDVGGSELASVDGLMVEPALFEPLIDHPTVAALRLVLVIPSGVPAPPRLSTARELALPCSAEELASALVWLADGA